MRKVSPARSHFLAEHPNCACCKVALSVDVHEIARGPAREKSLEYPETWLATCRRCHDSRLDTMPIARQLALKRIQSPELYDRKLVNKLRGRQDEAVTDAEVDHELETIEGWR